MTWTVQRMAKRVRAGVMGKAPSSPSALRGRVEALDGLLIVGWASVVGAAQNERITLWAQGAQVDAAVVRVEREDVRQAIEGASLHSGFEIEVPSQIWLDVPPEGQVELQVRVDGQPVPAVVDLRLSRVMLSRELAELLAISEQAAGLSGVQAQRYQYRLLTAIEHAYRAGLLPGLSPGLQAFVREQTTRYALQPVTVEAAGEALLETPSPEHDIALTTLWRAQREFNSRWAPDADPATVLEQTLQSLALGEDISQRFLQTLIPFFCGRRQYSVLRPRLDISALRAQANDQQAWAISLLLPECVAAVDFAQAALLVRRLVDAPGWLNTECVAQATSDLFRYGERYSLHLDPCKELLWALVALIDRIASDPWGRAHDAHLIDAEVSLLLLTPVLPIELATEVLEKAVRNYGLVPGFWRCVQQRWPEGVALPPRLSSSLRVMKRLQEVLHPGAGERLSVSDLELALALLRGGLNRWHPDAQQVAREVILALRMTTGQPAELSRWVAELEGMGPEELLRVAAHPLTEVQADLPADSLVAAVRVCTGVPLGPLAEQSLAAWRKLTHSSAGRDVRQLPTVAECRRLNGWDTQFFGCYLASLRLVLMAEQNPAGPGGVPDAELAELRGLWMHAWHQRATAAPPCAPLVNALLLIRRLLKRWPEQSGWQALAAEWSACLSPEWRTALVPPAADQLHLESPGWLKDTLVVVYSCRANLASRVEAIRGSWGRSLTEHGVPWVVLVGDGDGTAPTGMAGDLLALPVADTYERLPDKTLALMDWVIQHTDFSYLYKIDDDCHLDVATFLARSLHRCHHYMGRPLWRGPGDTDRSWHQARSASVRGAHALDKSPEPSVYADGGSGYFVSRSALQLLTRRSVTSDGGRLRLASFMEDKLVGDLLASCGFGLSSEGYETLVRRRLGPDAVPVNIWHNTFYPGRSSPVWVTHLDESGSMVVLEQALSSTALRPPRLWPTLSPPKVGSNANQLELLSAPENVAPLADAPVIVVAVARNEKVLMPHFLDHYRSLGVRHFVLVDNLSDDGTREYLLAQRDVVLYSADTEYRHSHYGVAWQQAVLGAHALGRWVVLADIDELLVYEDCEHRPITEWLASLDERGYDAAMTLMVDMYPQGDLSSADFTAAESPFEVAPWFDEQPVVRWQLGGGNYSNLPTYLSALRHRLIPDSAPNLYTSQKIAVFRYAPWVRLAQGLHYASNLNVAPEPVVFAHFKYHAGFREKVMKEIARKQHFNGAEEYRKYQALVAESCQSLFEPKCSRRWAGSREMISHILGISIHE